MRYLVQELVAHKWFTVRSFADWSEAEAFAKWLGRNIRIKNVIGNQPANQGRVREMGKRAHPAHRMSQYGPPVPAPSKYGEELDELIATLAECPTTAETPGAHRDDMTDELIGMARKWLERECRFSRWERELNGD